MSGFSSRNIDDIKNLYESVVEEDTTDVDEGFWRDRGADLRNASSNVANAVTSSADAVVQGVQGKSIPADRRRIAKITNAAVRGTRDAILDFGQGLNTGKSTPKEELSLSGNLIAEAPAEGSSKTVNGKTYYWNGKRYVDASGNQPPASATPPPQKPQQSKAERARAEREALQVVIGGGRSGYRSLMPKPTPQKGETAQAFDARMNRWNRSQQLAQRLTHQQQQNRASAPTPPPSPRPPATPPASSRPPAAATAPTPPPSSRPAPTPPAPSIERRMSTVTGKQEYVGATSSGEKFERRAATRAELAAAREARDKAKKAGSSPAEAERAAVTAGIKATQKESKMIKEPYDLVLEYLFSQGHVDTLDEAHYVMLQMDGEYIQSIIESPGEWFRGIIPNNSAVENEKTRLPSTIPPLPKPVNGTRPAPGKGGKNRAEVGNQYNVNLVK